MLNNVIDSKNFREIKMEKVSSREHVRVDDILKVDYLKISNKDYKKCKSKPEVIFKNTFGAPIKVPDIEERAQGVDLELLYNIICQANHKIDRILDMLESQNNQAHAFVGGECINISGSGMRFAANHRFSIGDIIALRVFLPMALASRSSINVLGKVKSVTKTDSKNSYDTAIKFKNLSEDDREIIIRYVFTRQRELLRISSDLKTDKD